MVAIFFAISGYVVCRHILRSIHQRRLDAVYQSLSSSVFRRAFRLYIPPTISMFIVAILAQTGAFKSEEAIFTGPDSHYINGTITYAQWENQTSSVCPHNLTMAAGPIGVAEDLDLWTTDALLNITADDKLCLNITSGVIGPAALYSLTDEFDMGWPNITTKEGKQIAHPAPPFYAMPWGNVHRLAPHINTLKSVNYTGRMNTTWVQLGGSWEEHPLIHPNMTYALQNFTRTYGEWANPFNFGHYHTRYDPHTFTIPMELRGSMVLYIFLLGTAALKAKWRLGIGACFSAYSLWLARWDIATFMGGCLLSEMDIRQSADTEGRIIKPPVTEGRLGGRSGRGLLGSPAATTAGRWVVTLVALYFLSYPDAGAEWTPGFMYLASWVPKYYHPLAAWMFYQSMGALLLLPCVLRSSVLRTLLESRVAQYLGKVSFSLYLIHGPVLHCLGFWLMPRLFDHFGKVMGYAVGWVILMSITMYLTNCWHKYIDGWSVTLGKRMEKLMTE